MDKQTLSNYGWVVIVTLILAVMLALATPFGTYVGDAVVGVANGFVNTNNKQISDDNLEYVGHQWNNKLDVLNPKGVIPADAIYYSEVGKTKLGDYSTATATYKKGDRFPEPKDGDVYVFGDYEYRYNMQAQSTNWNFNKTLNGWGVHCGKEIYKSEYGKILLSINNKYITTTNDCFYGNGFIEIAPEIPPTVKNITLMFWNCKNLKQPPSLKGCNVLDSATNTFCGCTSLIDASRIKFSETQINALTCTFKDCISLKYTPEISKQIISLNSTFDGCVALEKAPILHENIVYLNYTFENCINLSGNIVINVAKNNIITNEGNGETIHGCVDCLLGTVKEITLTGSASEDIKELIASTADNNNVKIN